MRLLFAHDHRFKLDENGQLYAGGSYSNDVFARYLEVFDELVVMGRCEHVNASDCHGYNPITLPIIFYPVRDTSSLVGLLRNNRTVQAQIRQVVKECHAVISRGGIIGDMAVKAARKECKPWLREVVGCAFDALWYYGNFSGKVYAPVAFFHARKQIRNAGHVIYVTERFLQRRYPTRGKWINCSNVALSPLHEEVLEKRIKKILERSVTNDKLILGTIGALDVKYKGQQSVIEALGALRERGLTHFKYELVGDGDKSYLESVARKHGVIQQVEFLGRMTHDKVFEWLDHIDVFIQPSKTEGLPRALIEAMSRGLPCFGSRVGGIPELLDERCLFGTRRRNVDEIATLLRNLDKSDMVRQAERNFLVSQQYDRELLNKRRRDFLVEFREFVRECS